MHFFKLSPKVIGFIDLKTLENERFMNSLQSGLNSQNSHYVKNSDLFFNICQEVLTHYALRNNKYIRGNKFLKS